MNPPATDSTKPVKGFQVGTSSSSRARSALLIDTTVLADSWHELDGTPWLEYILEHCRARTMVSSFLGCASVAIAQPGKGHLTKGSVEFAMSGELMGF